VRDSLKALRLDVEGDFNSFRVGHLLQYQRTYLFPPKPTLVGLLGAALGLEDTQLVQLYKDIKTGIVLCGHQGFARDLWGITKLKTGGEAERAVVVREMLHRSRYRIFYAPSKPSGAVKLQDMEAAFTDPTYPLTLGRSDELIMVRSHCITDLKPAEKGVYYRCTVLPFDYRKRKHDLEKVATSKDSSLELPQVFTLPSSYSYDKTCKRSVAEYGVFTHVFSTGVSLRDSDEGWCDEDGCFFLY